MNVDPVITRQILEEEVKALSSLATSYNWEVQPDFPSLIVMVKMRSQTDQELYIVEAKCDNYKAIPPYFEFIHPETGERATPKCYPSGSSYFHSTPCICVQWNRKAYKSEGGPHKNWPMADWMQARPGTITLGDMFHLIQVQINQPAYKGRMA